ncbi:MAG: VapE domain-containing protein [Elainellaceae cyanobacterium]
MSIPTSINIKHWQEWRDSAVSEEIISLNIWTIEDPREVAQLLNRNTERGWKHSTVLAPGWAVAGCDPLTGERSLVGCQFKPNTPPVDKDGKPGKYLTPSQTPAAPLFLNVPDEGYWPGVYGDVSVPVVLTEVAKIAGAILTQGFAGISIPGVTTGGRLGRLKPQLRKLCTYGRKVFLAFDRDVVYKRQVQNALHNLARMISERGAMVYVLEWHDDYKGIDDYFAGRPDGMALRQMMDRAATLEEWRDAQDKKSIELIDEPCKLARRYHQVSDRIGRRLRWNTLLDQIELDGKPLDPMQLRMWLALKHNMDIPLEDCKQICLFVAQQSPYSPVTEYLEDCITEHPADSDLLDSVAETYLGATSELHRMFIRKTLISAVARAITPGCKVDTVCILTGDLGVGKSSFWRILAGEWFDDSFAGGSDKDERLKLHRCWLTEWAELETVFRRKDVSAVKAFISCQKDTVRRPYGHIHEDYYRPSILVGSTNHQDFLSDPTGNRRFWVVPVSIGRVPQQQLIAQRDRIWAAAYHALKAGESWLLPDHLLEQAKEATKDYAFTDPWEEALRRYIETRDYVTTTELLSEAIGLELAHQGKAEEMRCTNLLKSWGWDSKQKRVNGKKSRIWISPSVGLEVGTVGTIDNKDISDIDISIGREVSQPSVPTPSQPPFDRLGHSSQENKDTPAPTGCPNRPVPTPPFSQSSRTGDIGLSSPEEPSRKLYESGDSGVTVEAIADADCLAKIEGQWRPAKFLGEWPNMMVCHDECPGLKVYHRVAYLDQGRERKTRVCTGCSVRPLGADIELTTGDK